MKETKRKKISEKEDEYRARWRKRKLSPPRIDAFSTDSNMEPVIFLYIFFLFIHYFL